MPVCLFHPRLHLELRVEAACFAPGGCRLLMPAQSFERKGGQAQRIRKVQRPCVSRPSVEGYGFFGFGEREPEIAALPGEIRHVAESVGSENGIILRRGQLGAAPIELLGRGRISRRADAPRFRDRFASF